MTSEPGDPTSDPTGRLGPETSATLKRALQYYLEFEREFVVMFFPRIVERGYVTLADVTDLTPRQADALRPLLADSVRYFRRQEEKERGSRPPTPGGPAATSAVNSEVSRKAQLWAEALQEMCASFELSDPLETDS
jgi:hypothetical protein